MTDRITATLAVIEAAKEWRDTFQSSQSTSKLCAAIDTLADATSPDLDAKIAEAIPCNCGWVDQGPVHSPGCTALRRHAVRDLIVALLADERDNAIGVSKLSREDGFEQGVEVGYDRARKQAAQLVSKYGRVKDAVRMILDMKQP